MHILGVMNSGGTPFKVVVVGAGIAGATCARALALAGCSVQVVDKSNGPGGRLATRRVEWLDPQGRQRVAKLDHGAPAFAIGDAGFRRFLAAASPVGALASWRPTLAAGSRPLHDAGPLCLPQPDMPSLCRALLRDIAGTWSLAVDRLLRSPIGWQLESAGTALPGHFDAVVLALPPAQAAALLAPHRSDWAQRASIALMQPCWTLMGVARRPAGDMPWDVARPDQGPLAWVMRDDARPGRQYSADETRWVVHARSGWSRQHLEQPADWVLQQMQGSLQDWLGKPIEWQHAVVHRWRHAMPQTKSALPAGQSWWDGAGGLGVCGDFLGGSGVEGAWRSAQALSDAMLRSAASASATPAPSPFGSRPQRAAA
jgi:hypothetical protein